MPRRARLQIPGYPLHIVQRGHNRAACFLEPSGFELYLGLLSELRGDFSCRIHAFALMTNHLHLLLTPDQEGGASELMRHVNLRFVQAMNRRYGRTGSGFEGRFWSSVVETSNYLLACQRYIELNPVRAGIVRRPEQYRWSSYGANAYGEPCPFVEPHAEYLALGRREEGRRAAYRGLFAQSIDDAQLCGIRLAIRSSLPYGSDDFISDLESKTGMRLRKGKPGPKGAQAETAG
jgi:putative transposase